MVHPLVTTEDQTQNSIKECAERHNQSPILQVVQFEERRAVLVQPAANEVPAIEEVAQGQREELRRATYQYNQLWKAFMARADGSPNGAIVLYEIGSNWRIFIMKLRAVHNWNTNSRCQAPAQINTRATLSRQWLTLFCEDTDCMPHFSSYKKFALT
jgi:hypothetical protein